MENVNCKFCDIYKRQQYGEKIENYYDKILYENDGFFVVPATGSFVENYVLIISKRHINAMAYCSPGEQTDLQAIIKTVQEVINESEEAKRKAFLAKYPEWADGKKTEFYPVVFEHGSTDDKAIKTPQSIHHAHVHVLPISIKNNRNNLANDVYGDLGFNNVSSYKELFEKGFDKPYIFYQDATGQMHLKIISEKDKIQSQELRIRLALTNSPALKPSWREENHDANIMRTFVNLQPLFRKRQRNKQLRYIYYARAMDGLDPAEITIDYNRMQQRLGNIGISLTNSINDKEHTIVRVDDSYIREHLESDGIADLDSADAQNIKNAADFVVNENMQNLFKSDGMIVNMTRPNHSYVGCISELLYAREQGMYNITVTGVNKERLENDPYMQYFNDAFADNIDSAFDILSKINKKRKSKLTIDDGSTKSKAK